jgi:hypothetical protein
MESELIVSALIGLSLLISLAVLVYFFKKLGVSGLLVGILGISFPLVISNFASKKSTAIVSESHLIVKNASAEYSTKDDFFDKLLGADSVQKIFNYIGTDGKMKQLMLLVEREEYFHIPDKQPGPYQCHLNPSIFMLDYSWIKQKPFFWRLDEISEVSYSDIFGSTDSEIIFKKIKNVAQSVMLDKASGWHEDDNESLLVSIEEVRFLSLGPNEFTLQRSASIQERCSVWGPFKTEVIKPFFTELMKGALQ